MLATLVTLAATAFATLAVVPAAQAADLTLSKVGGGALQTTTLTLKGNPGTRYLLLVSPYEQAEQIKPGVVLEIPTAFIDLSVTVPGFAGALSAGGVAQASFVLPADPVILGLVLSFQALDFQPITQASNLVRLTPALPGSFENTLGDAALPLAGGAAIERADGTVLLVGGSGPVTQIYDSNREEFSVGGASFGVGLLGQSTALADGRILFTGGFGLDGQPSTAAALYDPVTDTTTTLAMLFPRAGHGASLMPSGKVLITGGFSAFALTDVLALLQGIQGSTEIFDPATLAFTAGPTLLEPRALHTSTTTSTGRVLIAGGLTLVPIVNIPTVSATAYNFNPANNSFGLPIFFSGARLMHSAVALDNGKVLLVGGLTADLAGVLASGDLTQIAIGSVGNGQLWTTNFLGGSFTTVPGLSVPRAGAGVAALPGGGALIAGGLQFDLSSAALGLTPQTACDVYSSASGFASIADLAAARTLPVLERLNDGTVLVVGGGPLSAEIFQP